MLKLFGHNAFVYVQLLGGTSKSGYGAHLHSGKPRQSRVAVRQFGETGRRRSTSTSTKSDHFFAKVRAHKAVQRPYSPGEVRALAFQLRVRAAKAYLTMSMAGQPRALWRKASVAALLAAKRMSAPLHPFRVHKSAVFARFAATTATGQFSHPSRVHEMR